MDQALSRERLGHYIVSRRVALGYRNRSDLAGSLQLTVRTLADVEHGVRKASPGTYAMLENKLAWAPGSVDSILAGGEPKETGPPNCAATPHLPARCRPLPSDALSAPPPRTCPRATTARRRAPRQTPPHLGRRRPRPTRRLARGGLAAAQCATFSRWVKHVCQANRKAAASRRSATHPADDPTAGAVLTA